ncbi:hypothetical protein DUNSADRAFT_7166 [Dunaliella salina]|uniref:N-acetyltransferase domain-containing protein n=1 Tax=Dunaliella salina TaxID=3046 RepID=A0ABQ7GLZ5_DUNSA|nr:hypothetical protein DUNSADRAFT_7166 [Dunaliella salina]|eukprot:KAF5835617.1 hypothetical protein DUNSADRAFT_7166 [Dunaliella salina]
MARGRFAASSAPVHCHLHQEHGMDVQLPKMSFCFSSCDGGMGNTAKGCKIPGSIPSCHPFFASISAPQASQPTSAPQQHQGPPLGSLLIQKQLPGGFVAEQRACESVIGSYHNSNEEFPRPCPLCNSTVFLRDEDGQMASISGRPPAFANRPWSCEQCCRFFHIGCLGANYVEDLPAKPWFHAHSCRRMFLKLEDLAEQGEQRISYTPPPSKSRWPSLLPWARRSRGPDSDSSQGPQQQQQQQQVQQQKWGRWGKQFDDSSRVVGTAGGDNKGSKSSTDPGSGYSCFFTTDVDQRTYLAQGPQRGPLPDIYSMLADVFPARALLGFGNPALEHSAGKYACLCCKDGLPVACATFNVHGDYAAQVHLMMTAPNARRQGHTRALTAALEEHLKKLGVPQLLVQPRDDALSLFTHKLGFDVVHPASAEVLWRRVPIAFTDSVLVGKDLTH